MNALKNIKKPAYAVEMGKGIFAGGKWQCSKCGAISFAGDNSKPFPNAFPKCITKTGNHIWKKV